MKEIIIGNRGFKERNDFVFKTKEKVRKVKQFCSDHKYELITAGSIILPIVAGVTKGVISRNKVKIENDRRLLDKYDPRTGEHYFIKKPLTNAQQLELERRYNNGESKGHILKDMGMF